MALTRSMLIVIAIFTIGVHLPFLDKSITYDDIIFLEYAKRLSWIPFHCAVSDYFFQGVLYEQYNVFESTHPPLIPYYLKILIALFGESPTLLHWGFLPLNVLVSVAFAALFTRYTKMHPALSLGLSVGPLFLPNATSLMTDVPLVGFWCAAMFSWEKALDAPNLKRSFWTYIAALMALATIFTAYQGLGLLVVLLGIGWYRGRIAASTGMAAALFLTFLVWLLLVYQAYGLFPYFAAPRDNLSIATEVHKGLVWTNMFLKAKVSLLYLGAALGLFVLVWMLRLAHVWLWAGMATLGWALALVMDLFSDLSWAEAWWPLVLFALGIGLVALLAMAVKQAIQERSILILTLLIWVLGFFGFQIALAPFAAPRYILAGLVPCFVLLFLVNAKEESGNGSLWHWVALVPMVLLGLLVARAEYRYAEAQRVDLLELPQLNNFYVLGEKGIKFSAQRAGLALFRVDEAERAGYLLVPSEIDRVEVPHELLQFAEEENRWTLQHRLPIRVMNRAAKAGFYIHTRGLLPFTFSNNPIETYRLLKIFHLAKPNYMQVSPDIRPAQPILPTTPVSQPFVCNRNGLTRIQVSVATYGRSNRCQVEFVLEELQETGFEVIAERSLAATELQDNSSFIFDFQWVPDSKGKTYRFTVRSPNADAQNAITVWTNRNVVGAFVQGEQEIGGTLNFNAFTRPADF